MKRYNIIKKIIILILLFFLIIPALGYSYESYYSFENEAYDCYSPKSSIIAIAEIIIHIYAAVEAVFIVIFLISCIFIFAGKKNNSEKVISISKVICENILYYIGFISGIFLSAVSVCFLGANIDINEELYFRVFISYVCLIISLFFRLRKGNKIISYFSLAISLMICIFLTIVLGIGEYFI